MKPMRMSPYLHTVDVVALRYVVSRSALANTLGLEGGQLQVLVHLRDKDPFSGTWALPGLVVNGDQADASITDAARRLMRSEKVAMPPLYMEQVGTEGNGSRDPRCWSSTTFYMAFVDPQQEPGNNQQFINVDDVLQARIELPFDHNFIVSQVVERLASKSLYSSLPFLLLGNSMTLTECAEVTSCILKRDIQKSSIRVRLEAMTKTGYLHVTEEKKPMPMGRAQVVINNLKPGEVYFFDRSFEK